MLRVRGGRSTVSCQCRASEFKHSRKKGGGEYYEPFEMKANEGIWEAYNRPENHWVTFTESDKVVWK